MRINGAINSINAAALILGAAGLLSRLMGIFRDRMLASEFGAGRELDLYYAAFQVPDFMVMLFVLGAGSAAILPIFQEELLKDEEKARRLISGISTLFFIGSLLATLIIFFITPGIIKIIVPGFSEGERETTITLTRIMIFSPVLFGLSGILSSVVQSFQRFLSYALAPLLYNLGIIMGIMVFVPIFGIKGLAWGVILGAFLHLFLQWLTVRNLGFSPRPIWDVTSDGFRNVIRLSLPRALSLSVSQLTSLVLIALGSTLAVGSIAVFQLSQNLYFLPIGIFGISYAVALFPQLSRAYITRQAKLFFEEFFLGVRSILFWVMPTLVLFIVLRAHIVRVALGAGKFSWEDTRLTAAVLAILSIGLVANSLMSLLIKGFYALENTWRPLFINIFSSFLSIALAVFFVKALSPDSWVNGFLAPLLRIDDLPDIRVMGLALGFVMGSLFNGWLLYWSLRRLAKERFREEYSFPTRSVFKIVVASFIAGGAAYLVRVSFSETLPLITFIKVLSHGAIAGVVGFAVYLGVLLLWGEESVRSLWQTARGRLFRIGILPKHWDGTDHPTHHQL